MVFESFVLLLKYGEFVLSLFLVGHMYLSGNMVQLVVMKQTQKDRCYDEIGLWL